jgi:ribosomal protein S18 acetylase RimI-like enzyme
MDAFPGLPPSASKAGLVRLVRAEQSGHFAVARVLIAEYAVALGRDLSFQGFAEELAALPGAYAPPGGALLLATVEDAPAACVALRAWCGDIAEMKRLYVRPAQRGLGLGESLARAILAEARALGYRRVRLDTLPEMAAAQALYQRLGFRPIPPYYDSPIAGTRFMEVEL